MDVSINYLGVILAAVSTMVVGAVWYSKGVFGASWMKLVGMTDAKAKEGSARAMSLSFVASLVSAYVLAHVAFLSNQFFGNSFLMDSLSTAFWLWLGLSAARMLTHDLFEARPTKLITMNIGFEFVTIMVMGLVIGLVGK